MRQWPTVILFCILALGCASGAQQEIVPENGYVLADDGTRLLYRVVGRGEKTVIVPLIQWNIGGFETIAGSDLRFVFYDPRSRGGSDTSTDPNRLTIDQDLHDLERVRSYFRAKTVSLVGTSYYGGLVARYAMTNPEKVDRVVMVGALPPESKSLFAYDPPEKALRNSDDDRARLEGWRSAGIESSDPVRFCHEYWRQENRITAGRAEDGARMTDRCDDPNEWPRNFQRWANHIFASMGPWDWRASAQGLQKPVLLIHGGHDLRSPLYGSREWRDMLPMARLLVIPDAGHSPWWDAPGEIFPAVRTFLEGSWPAGVE